MEPIRDRLKGIRHMAKAAAKAEKPLTKVQIFTNIAEATGLTKKQVAEVFDALKERDVGKVMAAAGSCSCSSVGGELQRPPLPCISFRLRTR